MIYLNDIFSLLQYNQILLETEIYHSDITNTKKKIMNKHEQYEEFSQADTQDKIVIN